MTTISREIATPYPFGTAERLDVHPRLAEVRQNMPVLCLAVSADDVEWVSDRIFRGPRSLLVPW